MVEAPTAAMVDSTAANAFYVRNMSELWRHDPALSMTLECLDPALIPPLEAAKDGHTTLKLGNIYLHSRYRPEQEAQAWAAGIKCEDKYVVIVSGFGLGYHVKALYARMPEDALLLIAEPNFAVLRAAFGAADFSEMLASPRVMIFTSLDRGRWWSGWSRGRFCLPQAPGRCSRLMRRRSRVRRSFTTAFRN